MRISGGKAKGIPLTIPQTAGLRPATEANRERLFSSLGNFITNKRALDLFAGSGSYGLEALSRGASSVHFVEKNRKVANALNQNLISVCKSAGLMSSVGQVSSRNAIDFLQSPPSQPFDLIFLDPPYQDFPKFGEKVFARLHNNGFVHHQSLLIHEAPGEDDSSFPNWCKTKTLGKPKRGTPVFRFFQPES